MKTIIAATILIVMFCGCVKFGGILKMSPDTYAINVEAWRLPDAKRIAYEEATKECNKQGNEFLVKSWLGREDKGRFELIFRCLPKGDPELMARPEYELKDRPDIRIEDSRKKN